jgi:RNase H-fold protein (predicted Holliday junction resolvase)
MRILAIDLGTKNMGLAITDKSATIINALNNFAFTQNNFSACYQKIKSVAETYNNEIDTIVLG